MNYFKKIIKGILGYLNKVFLFPIGLNPVSIYQNIIGIAPFIRDLFTYNSLADSQNQFPLNIKKLSPCLNDRYDNAGVASGAYFHQDLWMAKKIFRANPSIHWDIGSRVDGFIAHLLTFRSVNVIDFRELKSELDGLTFQQGDVTNLKIESNSIESLSCLHAMEHVGLGRYGDELDPIGYLKGMKELERILKPGGRLYFSVPIGKQRLEFNSQRVFNSSTVLNIFSGMKLVEFAAVDDIGKLIDPSKPEDFESSYCSCGLFVFEKLN